MKKLIVLTAVLCMATTAWAGPKDKSKGALVNTSSCRGTTGWDNEVVKATYSADANAMKIAWKGTGPVLDNQTVYCFLGAKSWLGPSSTANVLVMKGTIAAGGKLSMKGLVASVAMGVVPDTVQYDSTMDCYLDTTSGTYDPKTECENSASCAPGSCLWVPQDTVNYKDDNIEGVCENITNNTIPVFSSYPDASPLAVMGIGSFPETPTVTCP